MNVYTHSVWVWWLILEGTWFWSPLLLTTGRTFPLLWSDFRGNGVPSLVPNYESGKDSCTVILRQMDGVHHQRLKYTSVYPYTPNNRSISLYTLHTYHHKTQYSKLTIWAKGRVWISNGSSNKILRSVTFPILLKTVDRNKKNFYKNDSFKSTYFIVTKPLSSHRSLLVYKLPLILRSVHQRLSDLRQSLYNKFCNWPIAESLVLTVKS